MKARDRVRLIGELACRRGKVLGVDGNGCPTVTVGDETSAFRADRLTGIGSGHATLSPGDEVLVVVPTDGSVPLVVGRVVKATRGETDPPTELLLEASSGLTLKVGDSSITLRADGRILIRGKDIVSNAKQMNRIKGGAVSIN